MGTASLLHLLAVAVAVLQFLPQMPAHIIEKATAVISNT
jgi:uncharacterized protein with PQ loop repeat